MISRVICVHEKYYAFTEQCGKSACNQYIYESLKGSRLIEKVEMFPYDQHLRIGLQGMCDALWTKCNNERPEAIVFFLPWYDYWMPLVLVMNRLRSEGIKVVALCSDMVTGQVDSTRRSLIQFYSKAADCLLNIDSLLVNINENGIMHIRGYTGVSPDIFFWQPVEKDINVSFLGSRSAFYQSRREYLAYLKYYLSRRNIDFVVAGGQLPEEQENGEALDINLYAGLLRRSKITLNFSRTIGDACQLKGRVFEALACRTLLLEEENPNTRLLFEEGVDYRAFFGKEDLFNKIIYYLDHHEEREAMALSGWKKVNELWNARNLWGYVFEKLGFDISGAYDDQFCRHRRLMDDMQSA